MGLTKKITPGHKTTQRAVTCRASSSDATAFDELPILRLPPVGAGEAEVREFCLRLREVCHTIGFFYVADHGVPSEVCDGAVEASRRFFALPDDVKEAIDNRNSPAFRGYIRLGAENTAGLPDQREQIEFGVEAEAEPVNPDAPPYRRLVGPNQWPDANACPHFKEDILAFLDGMETLSKRIMAFLALSLDLPAEFFEPTFGDDPNVQMKVARYPPAPSSPEEGGVGLFGVGAHTDSGYLSILLQDDTGGLQVQNGSGEWIDAPPVRDEETGCTCMVVNLGEMLQLCTGGYYLATPHRVVSKDTERDRISVPYFWNPRLDAVISPIEPLPDTLEWARPKPEAVDATDSHGEGSNRLIGVYGINAMKSLARSHPEVMRRHHPDLAVRGDGTVEYAAEAAAA